MLTAEDRELLRETAWDSIRAELERRPHEIDLPAAGPLAEPGSAFVTLRAAGRLRGCIGLIGERQPLAKAVREAARRALADPRFSRVALGELDGLDLEVSVLTPFHPIAGEEEPEIGRHGLFIEARGRSGLLLPQVAPEQGWDRETFLENVCLKAGLAPDAWRADDARVCVFEAEVF